MARARSPDRLQAEQMWLDSGGEMPLVEIASVLGKSDGQIRKWKNQDRWEDSLNGNVTVSKGNVTNESKGNVTESEPLDVPLTKKGDPAKRPDKLGNGYAKGNRGNKNPPKNYGNKGGNGPPRGNDNAVTHGFFRKYFPDDEETQQILEDVEQMSGADMLWISIKTKFMAIIRAQKLMFVVDQDDTTKELKKRKFEREKQGKGDDAEYVETYGEEEFEIQFAWDKHATYLNAQARAMSELRSLIKAFCEMTGDDDKRRLELARMEQSIDHERARLQMEKEQLEIQKAKIFGVPKPDEQVASKIDLSQLSDEELIELERLAGKFAK